jgi:hypothetical protein
MTGLTSLFSIERTGEALALATLSLRRLCWYPGPQDRDTNAGMPVSVSFLAAVGGAEWIHARTPSPQA